LQGKKYFVPGKPFRFTRKTLRFKGLGRVLEKLVAPLVVLGLTDLVLDTKLIHRPPPQTLNHDEGLRLGIPFSAFHG